MKLWLCNNCNNRDHAAMYERHDAFHDIDPKNKKVNEFLTPGDVCYALSRMGQKFIIQKFVFDERHEGTDTDTGTPAGIMCGRFISGEILTKADALVHPVYRHFFNANGNLNQWSILTKD